MIHFSAFRSKTTQIWGFWRYPPAYPQTYPQDVLKKGYLPLVRDEEIDLRDEGTAMRDKKELLVLDLGMLGIMSMPFDRKTTPGYNKTPWGFFMASVVAYEGGR